MLKTYKYLLVHPKRTEVGICRRNAPNSNKGGCHGTIRSLT